jgi:hypothetical protein
MKKKTATNYFYDRMIEIFTKYHEEDVPTFDFSQAITEAFEQAKAIEAQQITEAFNEGALDGLQLGEEYYAFVYDTRTIH